MKKLIIFGITEMGQLAHYYFSNQSEYDVVAFTVDDEHLDKESFCGLPVISLDKISKSHPPEDNYFFVAMAYSKLNQYRKEKYMWAKSQGYTLASFISPKATVLNSGAIGDNCFIFEDNTIQPFVKIGNNITLWSGNHIGHHSSIADHCFVASHAVISGGVHIGEQCFIGVNATLRDHITIGEKCVIGAGALLLSDAAAEGVYIGIATQRAKAPSTRLRNI